MRNNLVLGTALFWMATGLLSMTLLLSTAMFLTDEDRYGSEGITRAVALYSLPGQVSLHEVTTALDTVAHAERVNIYKDWPSAENGVRTTDHFVFAGDPGSIIGDVRSHTFPSFGGRYTGHLYPGDAIERDQLLGVFGVDGTAQQVRIVMDALAALGVDVRSVSSSPAVVRWPVSLVGSPWAVR